MAELRQFNPIRVRLQWADGSSHPLPGPLEVSSSEWIEFDGYGNPHRFEPSGEVDAEGYHIFTELH